MFIILKDYSNLPPPVKETKMLPQHQQDTGSRDKSIFKLSPIHASVIHQIPWNRWIYWISYPFKENSIVSYERVCKNTGSEVYKEHE